MRMKDITVINRLPSMATSQSGMLAKKPTFSMASTISWGIVTPAATMPPIPLITDWTMPPQMEKTTVMISMAELTATLAAIKRMKWRRAYSGLCKSRKLAADWKIPMAKNSTSRP